MSLMESMGKIEPIMEINAVFSTSSAGFPLNAAHGGLVGHWSKCNSCFSWMSFMILCSFVDISEPYTV